MIEDLIETGQYKEALQYLNDMDNEQVRYQRLVCLYGLKELQQAKREGMKAKVLAGETYYDVVAIYVSILKDLEEFEEAINIIVEELSMPYIPYQYETVFNAAYDELLLAKQEASFDGVTQKVFNEEDIEKINNPINELDRNEIMKVLISELQYMHTWMQKEIDRGWEARQKTEDYYIGRENWNDKILKEKEQELEQYIEKYNETLKELEEIKNSKFWKMFKKLFKFRKNI